MDHVEAMAREADRERIRLLERDVASLRRELAALRVELALPPHSQPSVGTHNSANSGLFSALHLLGARG